MDTLHNEQKRKKSSQKVLRSFRDKNVRAHEKVPDEWKANKEIINFKNSEGWGTYKTATDNAANEIAEIANNGELTIDEVRERIHVIDEKLQRECFGTIWIKPKRTSGTNPKPKKEADELFKEHFKNAQKKL